MPWPVPLPTMTRPTPLLARCTRWLVAVIGCGLAVPVVAMIPAPDVIVARADADASGGWPVALWVVGAERSQLIVRAPREQLGRGPWQRADARALMALERFGAPTLTRRANPYACTRGLPAEGRELAHPPCRSGRCDGAAWRADLPGESGSTLPLRQLWPGLGAQRPQWMVLYVVTAWGSLPLKDVPQLHLADALRGPRSQAQWSQLQLPAEAAARFPEIHATMLEQAAQDQGLADVSAVMRADVLDRGWQAGDARQLRALGLADTSVSGLHIVRLLLRLQPGDRPARLVLDVGPWPAMAESGERLYALEPHPPASELCDGESAPTRQQRVETFAQRQRQAWRWVEQMTGRPAASWQAR